MTCYQRHMGWLFEALDVPYDAPNRKRVDGAIRIALASPDDAHCPEIWASIKALGDDAPYVLVPKVRAALAEADQ